MKKYSTYLSTLVTSIILFAGVPMLYAWTAPAAGVIPPAQNTPAPITVSDSNQNKLGALGLGGLAVFGKTLLTETKNYVLPTTKPSMLLGVNGAIGAKEYCDEKGMNCVTTLGGSVSNGGSVGGGSGWEDISINDKVPFDIQCEYRAFVPKKTNGSYSINTWYRAEDSYLYFIVVTPTKVLSAPSNDSQVYIPSDDKKAFYITPYGKADSWGLGVTKMQKRCGSASGGAGSNSQIISGWPNKILCDAGNQKAVLYVDGLSGEGYAENRVRYSSFQDTGPHTSLHFNYSNGNYISLVGRTEAFGKAIDACVAKGNIKNQVSFN